MGSIAALLPAFGGYGWARSPYARVVRQSACSGETTAAAPKPTETNQISFLDFPLPEEIRGVISAFAFSLIPESSTMSRTEQLTIPEFQQISSGVRQWIRHVAQTEQNSKPTASSRKTYMYRMMLLDYLLSNPGRGTSIRDITQHIYAERSNNIRLSDLPHVIELLSKGYIPIQWSAFAGDNFPPVSTFVTNLQQWCKEHNITVPSELKLAITTTNPQHLHMRKIISRTGEPDYQWLTRVNGTARSTIGPDVDVMHKTVSTQVEDMNRRKLTATTEYQDAQRLLSELVIARQLLGLCSARNSTTYGRIYRSLQASPEKNEALREIFSMLPTTIPPKSSSAAVSLWPISIAFVAPVIDNFLKANPGIQSTRFESTAIQARLVFHVQNAKSTVTASPVVPHP